MILRFPISIALLLRSLSLEFLYQKEEATCDFHSHSYRACMAKSTGRIVGDTGSA